MLSLSRFLLSFSNHISKLQPFFAALALIRIDRKRQTKTAFFALLFLCANAAAEKNGFDLSTATIPVDEILFGGPPRDGIPSIDAPQFINAQAADLQDDDLVLGLEIGGDARAYPINILNWHEVVNDKFGELAVAITYCPLCGSGVVFDASIGDNVLQFGVSGLLYNSDVLLYDRQTESLWSQLLRRGVSGEYAKTEMRVLPAQHTTWGAWRKMHPQSRVLSPQTGFSRDYNQNPYSDYAQSKRLYFPIKPRGDSLKAQGESAMEEEGAADDLHPKEWVLGVLANGAAKAYPFLELQKKRTGAILRCGWRTSVNHYLERRSTIGDN